MDRESYLSELAEAYQGEVRGEAGFAYLAARAEAAGEAQAWRTLARLEAETRARLEPLLRRHGLDTAPDPAQQAYGRECGERRRRLGWAGAMRAMAETLPDFVRRYAALEAAGPPEDKPGLAFLSAHEVALEEVCRAVLAGDADPLAPVRRLLGD